MPTYADAAFVSKQLWVVDETLGLASSGTTYANVCMYYVC